MTTSQVNLPGKPEAAQMRLQKGPGLWAPMLMLGSLMLAMPVAAADTYYRWIDKDGSTKYTLTPPPKRGVRVVKKVTVDKSPVSMAAPLNAETSNAAFNANNGYGANAAGPNQTPPNLTPPNVNQPNVTQPNVTNPQLAGNYGALASSADAQQTASAQAALAGQAPRPVSANQPPAAARPAPPSFNPSLHPTPNVNPTPSVNSAVNYYNAPSTSGSAVINSPLPPNQLIVPAQSQIRPAFENR